MRILAKKRSLDERVMRRETDSRLRLCGVNPHERGRFGVLRPRWGRGGGRMEEERSGFL